MTRRTRISSSTCVQIYIIPHILPPRPVTTSFGRGEKKKKKNGSSATKGKYPERMCNDGRGSLILNQADRSTILIHRSMPKTKETVVKT